MLNFGHTAGHAIEKLHNFTTISHGEAVGIGMVMIARSGERNGITPVGSCARIESVLKKYSLVTKDENSVSDIISAMKSDKKAQEIQLILCCSIPSAMLFVKKLKMRIYRVFSVWKK